MLGAIQKNQPLHEQIYQRIKEAIFSGSLNPGDRVIEVKIAEEFGVSRSPVREALRKLEQEGFLINSDLVGLTVFAPSQQDMQELYECRLALETMAVSLAAVNITKEELHRLEKNVEATFEALSKKQNETIMELTTEFHDLIVKASANSKLQSLIGTVYSLILIQRSKYISRHLFSLEQEAGEHCAILKALQAQDGNKAEILMRHHLSQHLEQWRNIKSC